MEKRKKKETPRPFQFSWNASSLILPFTNSHAHSAPTMATSKKLNTRLPPKTMLW